MTSFRPAEDVDPAYTAALRKASAAGVEILAYTAKVAKDRLALAKPLPVDLD